MKAFVIAVSGISGSGKTIICDELKRRVFGSTVVSFGDYAAPYPMSHKWFYDGADFDAIDLGGMRTAVEELRTKQKCECILLDYPFGWCCNEMNPVIDFVFYLDTAFDIALARRLEREFREYGSEKAEESVKLYRRYGYGVSRKLAKEVKMSADCVMNVDGDIDAVLEKMTEYTKKLLINRYMLPEKKKPPRIRRIKIK